MRILVVDDEEKIRSVLKSYLEKAGYRVYEIDTGSKVIPFLSEQQVDFIILDLMLPDVSGEELCQQIRQRSAVPILMLTAKSSEANRIHGLELGADDYVIKPFSPREVVARVKTILRRSGSDLLAAEISFHDGDLRINTNQEIVYRQGQPVNLTPIEYQLLVTLARNPLRVFTRSECIIKVYGYDYEGDPRVIDQHVKNLRQKIERDPANPTYIQTVFGKGYCFGGRD